MVRVSLTFCLFATYSLLATSFTGVWAEPSNILHIQNHKADHQIAATQKPVDNTVCSIDDVTGEKACYPRLFVATNEFQPILPGQDVPPGLHIQIDMSTGNRLARLMEPAEKGQENALAVAEQHSSAIDNGVPSTEKPKAAAASYSGNASLQDHIDQLATIALAHMDFSQTDTLLHALGELEELVHETRHAEQLMRDQRSVPAILRLSSPGDTSNGGPWPSSVRRLASVILGSAVQNNPKLQDAAFAAGAIPSLLKSMVQETDMRTTGKHIFALSALVRGHAGALRQFTDEGGMRMLRELNPMAIASSDTEYEAGKLELRIIRFVEDIFNPEFNPGVSRDAAGLVSQNAATWCHTLAMRLVDSMDGAESIEKMPGSQYTRRSAYAWALQSLRTAYPDTCVLPAEFRPWLQIELASVKKTAGDEMAEGYRQALTELDYHARS
ncbi:nucleotide exchange factor sil1 [Coemansia sp. Benny D115]|nr:nucleotide exchange factor sil1 [Coemansia sp. Benny D115]